MEYLLLRRRREGGCGGHVVDFRNLRHSRDSEVIIMQLYSETSLIRHSMGPENIIGLGSRLLD